MATSFIPLSAIIAVLIIAFLFAFLLPGITCHTQCIAMVLIIAFLFAFLLQVSHKTRYIVLCREESEEDWHKV